jgi:hypothetical protein
MKRCRIYTDSKQEIGIQMQTQHIKYNCWVLICQDIFEYFNKFQSNF